MKWSDALTLLKKGGVSELAALSKFSPSYVSQVKNKRCPPSVRFLEALDRTIDSKKRQVDYYNLFLDSRRAMGVSPKTIAFYQDRLLPFLAKVPFLKASRSDIEKFLNTIPANHNGLSTRHASFRAIMTFYNWLASNYELKNPMSNMPAPILSKVIMPSLTVEEVKHLIELTDNIRDKAIIALFVESGLRVSELANIRVKDIDWSERTIQVLGKGRKESLAAFGEISERHLRELLVGNRSECNIWGINQTAIQTMLQRLKKKSGLPCNPHTFRRTFACLLRKAGVDSLTIKDLGRWESIEMVQRYTRSIRFRDSLKLYKAPLG